MSNDSMGDHAQFASSDALTLAEWLDVCFDLGEVRKAFEKMTIEERVHFEGHNAAIIQNIIRRSEGQRPAYLQQVGKRVDSTTCGLAIVFAILGLGRVRTLIEMRDRFRSMALGPGYRVACSDIYERQRFFTGSLDCLTDYHWPESVFLQYTGDFSWMDGDAKEDDDLDPDD
jgi:hypothetical protein